MSTQLGAISTIRETEGLVETGLPSIEVHSGRSDGHAYSFNVNGGLSVVSFLADYGSFIDPDVPAWVTQTSEPMKFSMPEVAQRCAEGILNLERGLGKPLTERYFAYRGDSNDLGNTSTKQFLEFHRPFLVEINPAGNLVINDFQVGEAKGNSRIGVSIVRGYGGQKRVLDIDDVTNSTFEFDERGNRRTTQEIPLLAGDKVIIAGAAQRRAVLANPDGIKYYMDNGESVPNNASYVEIDVVKNGDPKGPLIDRLLTGEASDFRNDAMADSVTDIIESMSDSELEMVRDMILAFEADPDIFPVVSDFVQRYQFLIERKLNIDGTPRGRRVEANFRHHNFAKIYGESFEGAWTRLSDLLDKDWQSIYDSISNLTLGDLLEGPVEDINGEVVEGVLYATELCRKYKDLKIPGMVNLVEIYRAMKANRRPYVSSLGVKAPSQRQFERGVFISIDNKLKELRNQRS